MNLTPEQLEKKDQMMSDLKIYDVSIKTVEKEANKLKEETCVSEEEKQVVLACLREYWEYKRNKMRGEQKSGTRN